MGTKSFFAIFNSKFVGLLVLLFLSTSCLKTTNPFQVRGSEQTVNAIEENKKEDENLDLTSKASDKPFRPKVFLVLGPGISRTLAHIGVLKEIASSEIPIAGVVGLGWAGLTAAEFADQGSTHGLEWKVSRSKELKALTSSSFWRKALEEKDPKTAQTIINKLLTDSNMKPVHAKFYVPLLSLQGKKLILANKTGLKHSISVPPLFDSGERYAPYFYDFESLVGKTRALGAEKIIYIDVLNKRSRFWSSEVYGSAVKSYWAFASQISYSNYYRFDKVFSVKAESTLLDFSDPLSLIRSGESTGQDLVEFLKKEYQY